MTAGRPQKWDRSKVATDLLNWAKQPDSINLNKFCALYEPSIPPSLITVWAKESEEFMIAYESAKTYLGFRREEMLSSDMLHVKAYDLNATTYDYFLKEEKRKQAEFESNLRKQEEGVKQTNITLQVPHGLAIGSNLPTAPVSDKGNPSS